MQKTGLLLFFLGICFMQPLAAQLRLPGFFSSGMVLQQQKTNRIWGWAAPGQFIQVDFMEKKYPAFADEHGHWQIFLPPLAAGKAGQLQVTAGVEKLQFDDILIGEVWICSGQSNMEWRMSWIANTYDDELKTAQNDQIRFVTLQKAFANSPQKDAIAEKPWSAISPTSLPECSAVAYFYAKRLQEQLKVPVGLVITSWGGTPAESWTSFEGLQPFSGYTETYINQIKPLDLQEIARRQQKNRETYALMVREKQPYLQSALQFDFDDSKWQQVQMPRPWEQQGLEQLDGIMVYRFAFDLPSALSGKAAVLHLPAIDDSDSTYLNGVWIGSDNQWNAPRTYTIPRGVLRKGKNVLAIRVQDNAGGGGFAAQPDKFFLLIQSRRIPLSGIGRYEMIAPFEQVESGPVPMQVQPAVLYNAMIAPLLPLAMRGVIWYQGESNANHAAEYRALFPAMIQDWRNRWGQGEFPFLFVQLSSFGKLQSTPVESNWALLREAQTMALRLPNTAMAVTIDIGDPADIHPKQKKEVGDRLAAEALRMVYAQNTAVSAGPKLIQFMAQGNRAVLEFEHAGSGLTARGGPLKHFAIAGADRKFYWAEASIEGNKVILRAPEVPIPVAVRYAWADSPVEANLFNPAGFPAEPFRTDNW